ncbi:MAG: hypothetical protein HYX75_09670 [Acidobacteria bacterium]|nr:hypothetical protein [Acidobacteriota bacterium]
MPFCPKCLGDYVVGIQACPDCGLALVETPPLDERDLGGGDVDLVEVFHGPFWQVALVRGLLDEQQIQTVVYETAPLSGLLGQVQPPYQRLMMSRVDYEGRLEDVKLCCELVAEADERSP